MKRLMLSLVVCSVLVVGSCEKSAGKGGTSSISGRVQVLDVNGLGQVQDEYWGMDEDVFIVYGDADMAYDDKVSCSYDGSYRFDYLTPGVYTLFSYSDCDTCNDGKMVVKTAVEILENKTEYTAPNIVIYK